MKYILILTLLLTSIHLYGQRDYKYVYELNQDAELIITDSMTIRGRDTSRIQLILLDENDLPISFCKVKLENSDTTFNQLFDKNGVTNFSVLSGNWSLKITSPEFKDFNRNIQLNKNEELQLNFHLVALEDKITIFSQTEMNRQKLDRIKYCVATHKKPHDCIKKEVKIVIEI